LIGDFGSGAFDVKMKVFGGKLYASADIGVVNGDFS